MALVHRQRRDPIAGLADQPFKRLGELPRIGTDPGPIGPAFVFVGPARHDFAMRMLARGMLEQARHEQHEILHSVPQHRPYRPTASGRQPVVTNPSSASLTTSSDKLCHAIM